MLYSRNSESNLDPVLFRNPTSEYRGTPFWAWNCALDKEMLMRQIDQLHDMGMGGFHIHCRTGMALQYLGDEFMELVKACNEKAKQKEMLCWLYDEDRWPSGFAGGLVTKDLRYRARYIIFSPVIFDRNYMPDKEEYDQAVDKNKKPKGYLISKYEVVLNDGFLTGYRRLAAEEEPEGDAKAWWAYMEVEKDNAWFNNQAYVNVLDPEAIKKFIEITHEKYYQVLGEDFGETIPAIFTDEPQFTRKDAFNYAEEEKKVIIPYTDDFNITYKQTYREDLIDRLPELFWELPGGEVSPARYRYHDHLSERFVSTFADTIGKWCDEHGIMLTGHLESEGTLYSQTSALGDAMRSYRSFQLPGIDILFDGREFSTAKQAQSAAHQYDRQGVLSEMYGVTNWDFDFKGHKLQGDWQAALGITVRVHHLSWVSMAGESKRDYPASIGYQSPWYKEYRLVEDYFSRLNTALTRGKPRVRIGVIHPVESYWLYWGAKEQTSTVREELEENFNNTIQWLLLGLLDFDFVCESLLPSLCSGKAAYPMKVGAMEYDVIVVPDCRTLRSTTVCCLESFVKAGGQVIFAGESAKLVDAVKSDRVIMLAEKCDRIPMSRSRLISALDKYRDVDVWLENGIRSERLIYQMRSDGDGRWLFICNAFDKPLTDNSSGNVLYKENILIKIKGIWNPVRYNALDGSISPCPAEIRDNETCISREFSIHDSILIRLEPGTPACSELQVKKVQRDAKEVEIKDPVAISLTEPNVLLLDIAEYSLDGGDWEEEEELLRIDNLIREKLHYPLRTDAMAQPWVDEENDTELHELKLRFVFWSDISMDSACLALENAGTVRISVNGVDIPSTVTGWFVDESIQTVELPKLPTGKNEIILKMSYRQNANVEWCYLLGDFGVRVDGRHKRIIGPVRTLAFGDWTSQGLPFYAGNVVYKCAIQSEGARLTLEAAQFRNPLLSVSLDGVDQGRIAFAPYTLDLGYVEKGEHRLDISAYGNRHNAFGAIHNCSPYYRWFGPSAWKTTGHSWSYQYRLKPMGIMVSPKCYVRNS